METLTVANISVVIFTFNRANLLKQCIESVLSQSFRDIEIIVSDNCSQDNTEATVSSIDDVRVKYFKNNSNLGLQGNLQAGTDRCKGRILYLMGDDDLLLEGALQRTWDAFERYPQVGMVTRPYYWFIESPDVPVRAVKPFDVNRDTLVTIDSDWSTLQALYQTAGQISGLAFRRDLIRCKFHHDIFTTHIYIFSDLLKQGPVLLLKDYVVAVRINESMSRHNPEIYEKSPAISWIEMFYEVFDEQRYEMIRSCGVDMIAGHCEGLVQIKNYGTFRQVLREIRVQILSRPKNLVSTKYLAYSILVIITPRSVLVRLTEWYKRKVLAGSITCNQKVASKLN